MQKREIQPREAHRKSEIAMLGGTAAAVVGVLVLTCWGFASFPLLALGIFVVIWGFIYAHQHCVCSSCGSFLGESFRVPSKLPDFCPHCGQRV